MLTGDWGLPEQGTLAEAWSRDHAALSIIQQACLARREDRYSSDEEMRRDLRRLGDWRPSLPAPAGAMVVEPIDGALERAGGAGRRTARMAGSSP